jgi:chromosome segregation ATPase
MTKLDRADTREFNARIKRRKRLSADLGLVAATTGAAAIGLKGTSYGAKKLVPIAAKTSKTLEATNKAGNVSTIASGSVGSAAGINTGLTTQAELKRQDGKRKDVYRVKRQLSKRDSKRKQYFYGNNLEQRRSQRNKLYPGAAAAGSIATGGAAVGINLLNRQKKNLKNIKSSSKRGYESNSAKASKVRNTIKGLDTDISGHDFELKSLNERKNALLNGPTMTKERGGRLVVDRKGFEQKKNDLFENIKDSTAKHSRAVNDRNQAYSQHSKLNRNAEEFKAKSENAKFKLRRNRYRLIPKNTKKATLVLGGASAGLAGISAIAHRNNKKGVNRPRHDWWQG